MLDGSTTAISVVSRITAPRKVTNGMYVEVNLIVAYLASTAASVNSRLHGFSAIGDNPCSAAPSNSICRGSLAASIAKWAIKERQRRETAVGGYIRRFKILNLRGIERALSAK